LPGFTLIELLIVVAIIAILAAIAVPSFLEAQTRAKVARARADMRTLSVALELYATDHNAYPQAEINGTPKYLIQLTTPIAYLASLAIDDPFTPDEYVNITKIPTFRYYGFNGLGVLNAAKATGKIITPRSGTERLRIHWYAIFCHGPNAVRDYLTIDGVSGTFIKNEILTNLDLFAHFVYDPTNGTTSPGEIFRSGGTPVGATGRIARFLETSGG